MTHIYSAGGSRRAAVFTAIIALHFAIFLVVINDPIPVVGEKDRDRGPITVLPLKPLDPELVPPDAPGRVEMGGYSWPKPILEIPSFDDSETVPTAPDVGGDLRDGLLPQLPPVVRFAASLKGRSSDFAGVIRACYPAGARRAGEEGSVLIAVMIGTQGQVRSWRMVQSSGFPRLDAAVACVLDRLKFNAAREDGRAVQSEVLLPVVFRLD